MCGIIGKKGPVSLESLKYRGRDAARVVRVGDWQVGHTLHAMDGLVPQPFVEGDFWFAGNLEVYNWRELAGRYGIEARNDAELAFELIRSKGEKALDLFDGPYAVAFGEDRFTVARDLLGVFPLFYGEDAFCSERMPGLRELNPRHRVVRGKDRYIRLNWRVQSAERAVEKLDALLRKAVEKRLHDSLSLLFSGGIDSTLLASYLVELGASFDAVTVGLPGSRDLAVARKIASRLGFPLRAYELSRSAVLDAVPLVSRKIQSSDPVKVETALVIYFASLKAGSRAVLTGLGADELFGGYARMHRDPELESYWAVKNVYERSTYFTNVAALLGGAEARVPFLDRKLVEFALSLPGEFRKGKAILRDLFRERTGIAPLPKKAAQYGSGFSRVIPRPKSAYLREFWRKNRKVAALVSGGKDSWYALHIMKRLNYDIACIVTLRSRRDDSWMFHVPEVELVREQAGQAGIPLIFRETSGKKEEELADLRAALQEAVERFGVEGVVSGAISSVYQRSRIETVADELGLAVYAPLWGTDQKSYLRRLVREGFRFVIVSVSADGLDESWIGREVDVEELIKLSERYRFNPAGEGGEYETTVVKSPYFDLVKL